MARKKKDDNFKLSDTGEPLKPQTEHQRNVLFRAFQRIERGVKAMQHDVTESLEDLRFANNEGHWDDIILAKRQTAGKPSLLINGLIPELKDMKGEERDTKPYTVVKAGRGGTKDVADHLSGHIRYRKYETRAEDSYDWAFDHQIQGGFGAYRIHPEFESPESFDLTPSWQPILNPSNVVWDENAQLWHKNDGEWFAIITTIGKEDFIRRWPGVTPQDFSVKGITASVWYPDQGEKFLVAEYYEKEHHRETIYLLSDDRIVKAHELPEGMEKRVGALTEDGITSIKRKRVIDRVMIWPYLLCGHYVLEERDEWPCDLWGVIPVWGDQIAIGGKVSNRSTIRFSRDAVRAYELSRSSEIEALTMAQKASVKATPAMLEGHTEQWNDLEGTYAYKYYNPDPMMPGRSPEMLQTIDPVYIQSLTQSTALAREEIRQTVGPNIVLPRTAQALPNTSGRALQNWRAEGDLTSNIFFNNLEKAIEWGDLVFVRMVQRLYDTARTITVRSQDGTTKDIQINELIIRPSEANPSVPEIVKRNDFTEGSYTVKTTLGPSYQRQREALAEKMVSFTNLLPDQIRAGTAHILASMMFDIQQGTNDPNAGPLADFIKTIKKLLLKMGLMDPTDLREEELNDFAPLLIMLRQKPLPPALASKLRTEFAKAASLFAKADKDMAMANQVAGQTAIELMQFLQMVTMAVNQLAMQPMIPPPQPQPGQSKPGQAGGGAAVMQGPQPSGPHMNAPGITPQGEHEGG